MAPYEGQWLAITALQGHRLYWPKDNPAWGTVHTLSHDRITSVMLHLTPYTEWEGWAPNQHFPVHTGELVARPATDDEIARVEALLALLPKDQHKPGPCVW